VSEHSPLTADELAIMRADLGRIAELTAAIRRSPSDIRSYLDALRVQERLPDAGRILASLDAITAERDRLRAALVEALEWGDEGWSYASDYVREKWNCAGERARIAAALALAPADDRAEPEEGSDG
jgi:hypothetical protein